MGAGALGSAAVEPRAPVVEWSNRGKLPTPDYRLGQSPGWLEETISPWIEANRR